MESSEVFEREQKPLVLLLLVLHCVLLADMGERGGVELSKTESVSSSVSVGSRYSPLPSICSAVCGVVVVCVLRFLFLIGCSSAAPE